MKKKWIQPHITIQPFEPNEYVAVCWGVACSTMQANYVEQTWWLPNGGTNFDAGQNHRNHHCGTTGNQWLVDENNDGTPEVMREINTDGLGTLTCTLYTNDQYTDSYPISEVDVSDYIYWTTSSGNRVWHHQGYVTERVPGHPNRS